MCGRFTLRTPADQIATQFAVQLPISFKTQPYQPRYNIAPSQDISVIVARDEDDHPSWEFFRWGLIPSWSKDEKIGNRLVNARAETLSEKPSFRSAFKKRRCLVLADGFYEWEKTESGKQPYHFSHESGKVLAFAGLWERWSKDDPVFSCTIITTTANELLSKIHDRMPVILDTADHELWLDSQFNETAQLQDQLKPYPAEEMVSRKANRLVNSVRNESPECLIVNDGKTQGELF